VNVSPPQKGPRPASFGGNMALTFSVVDTWDDGKRIHVSGTVAAKGN